MSHTSTFKVTGMTCAHCVGAVTGELSALPGVTTVDVDLQPGEVSAVTVTGDRELDPAAVADAVDEAGYTLVES
jgi:copper chaperone